MVNYIPIEKALELQRFIIDTSGGKSGIYKDKSIEVVLDLIQNDIYYPTLICKLTHLVFCVNKNHLFLDGNKRTSIALGAYFLEINGLESYVDKFITTLEDVSIQLAIDEIDKEGLRSILRTIVK